MASRLFRTHPRASLTSLFHFSSSNPKSFSSISRLSQPILPPSKAFLPFNRWNPWWDFKNFSFGSVNLVISQGKPKFETHEIDPRKKQKWKTKKLLEMQRKNEKQKRKSERKPLLVGVNELKRRARLERQMRQEVCEIILHPPENGLLVENLVPISHEVFAARTELFLCVSKVMESIPIHSCRLCGEVHVGPLPNKIRTCNVAWSPSTKEHSWERGNMGHILPLVESFHLYDRLGRAVSHGESLQVDRIPAIVELCVQAGVDIPEYPTRRRTFPVYNISGRTIDFERRFPKDDSPGKDINAFGFWEKNEKRESNHQCLNFPCDGDLPGFAVRGMEAWEKMRSGALKLMQKYAVKTCGYCPEVQVGPQGHRVRQCYAYKHQMRDGQHAWQEAMIDDLVPPVYVWHVQDPNGKVPLLDRLKRYYGKLPAAVELFVQAGAHAGEDYTGTMREDIVVPELDEEKWVV